MSKRKKKQRKNMNLVTSVWEKLAQKRRDRVRNAIMKIMASVTESADSIKRNTTAIVETNRSIRNNYPVPKKVEKPKLRLVK
jgi:hypothetical protein